MTLERRESYDDILRRLEEGQKETHKRLAAIEAEMSPVREFMKKVDAAKLAAFGLLGIITALGATVSWFLQVKDHIHHKP